MPKEIDCGIDGVTISSCMLPEGGYEIRGKFLYYAVAHISDAAAKDAKALSAAIDNVIKALATGAKETFKL